MSKTQWTWWNSKKLSGNSKTLTVYAGRIHTNQPMKGRLHGHYSIPVVKK